MRRSSLGPRIWVVYALIPPAPSVLNQSTPVEHSVYRSATRHHRRCKTSKKHCSNRRPCPAWMRRTDRNYLTCHIHTDLMRYVIRPTASLRYPRTPLRLIPIQKLVTSLARDTKAPSKFRYIAIRLHRKRCETVTLVHTINTPPWHTHLLSRRYTSQKSVTYVLSFSCHLCGVVGPFIPT